MARNPREQRLPTTLIRWLAAIVALFAVPVAVSAADAQGTNAFTLLVSASPDRSNPVDLEGATVSGSIFAFVAPESGASQVKFWIDNPSMSGTPFTYEKSAPWDLAGGNKDGTAKPYATTALSDGQHTVTAAVSLSGGGSEILTASFVVANGGGSSPPPPPPPPPSPPPPPPAPTSFGLYASASADRSGAAELGGQTLSGNAYVFVLPESGATQVRFWIDNPSMSGTPFTTEKTAPWDLAGGNKDGTAKPYDTSRLSDGTHTVTAAVTLSGGGTEVVSAEFAVSNGGEPPPPPPPPSPPPPPPPPEPSSFGLYVSEASNRSAPAELAGRSLAGDAYIFVLPESGATQVRFWVDDPSMTGTPDKTEKSAPWDLAGGASDGTAFPFDTTELDDGAHSVTAAISLSGGGTEIVSADFLVTNSGPALVAEPSALAFAALAGGAPSTQNLSVSASTGTASVALADDASWLTVAPATGTTPASVDVTVDPDGLAPGLHSATVSVSAPGYTSVTLPVSLHVRDSLVPDQVHLAWVDDPSTTMTVIWRTWSTSTPSTVQFRRPGDATWQAGVGALRPSGTEGTLHEVTLTSLSPDTEYEYRVRADDGSWSSVYRTNTAPAPGPADFDAVYVADTGLVGRLDGLATGTQQVVDEIAALDPDLVLLGGDYAYYNTDTRYGTLDATIDAWFNQMQPVGSSAPMMPVYGNHEILLGEGFEFWAPRFATPNGFDSRRFYSFDVGDVHFVALFAVTETNGLSSSALAWIESDITAALAAGKRWIVPFFHVSPFSDGSSHPSNLGLRNQLGPLFERLGVKLAIASHDQSYERTYPLVDVPATNTPTSLGKRCYTMDDGVTWVKVSPGGKLSNKNGNFSQWRTEPPPPWTAVRDNTMHHFARLVASSEGVLRLDTYGVVGDGTPPVIVDTFEYRETCPAELSFGHDVLDFSAVAGGSAPAGKATSLSASDGSAAGFTLQTDATWLGATPLSGTTPSSLQVLVDPAGLAPGLHQATLRATAGGYVPDELRVTLAVRGLMVSTSPDRSAAANLAGATLTDDAYVFTTPDAGVDRVRFWLDNPSMSGTPRKTEGNGPFDFAGTAADGSALPFDTNSISNGTHSITAALDLVDGTTEVVTSSFVVSNP